MNTETTTHTTTLQLDQLAAIIGAVALHASTDKNRLALTPIKITPTEIVATDSYTLAIFTPDEPITTGEPIHVDAKEITQALNQATKQNKQATATLTSDGHTWQLTAGNSSTTGHCINIEYPNYKQLINDAKPATTPLEPTGFNPEYIARLAKASAKLDKNKPLTLTIWQTPLKPILFETNTDTGKLTQLIMPQRITN